LDHSAHFAHLPGGAMTAGPSIAALTADGMLHATAFYYKLLDG